MCVGAPRQGALTHLPVIHLPALPLYNFRPWPIVHPHIVPPLVNSNAPIHLFNSYLQTASGYQHVLGI